MGNGRERLCSLHAKGRFNDEGICRGLFLPHIWHRGFPPPSASFLSQPLQDSPSGGYRGLSLAIMRHSHPRLGVQPVESLRYNPNVPELLWPKGMGVQHA